MNINEWLETVLFTLWGYEITIARLGLMVLSAVLLLGAYWLVRRFLPRLLQKRISDQEAKRKIWLSINSTFLLMAAVVLIASSGINPEIYAGKNVTFYLISIFGLILIWLLARLTDQLISQLVIQPLYQQQEESKEHHSRQMLARSASLYSKRTVQYFVYLLAVLLALNAFNLDRNLFKLPLKSIDLEVWISISDIIRALLILLIARLLIWIVTQVLLLRYYRRKEINIGSQFAINQLVKYFFYVIAVLIALDTLGINMTIIWGGAAALLIGVGLGLQQTFNDFFSGLLLLFERSVEVGDVVNVGGLVGTVRQIGPRASKIQTRDNITVIVPNSKLVVDNVINWSHVDKRARFYIPVGVAYGSDTALVRELLINAAKEHKKVLSFPSPFVRFMDFGDSSLNFELHFWSSEFIRIEDVKSDLRFTIDQAFRDHQVTIPFPQRDVWFKNPVEQKGDSPQKGK